MIFIPCKIQFYKWKKSNHKTETNRVSKLRMESKCVSQFSKSKSLALLLLLHCVFSLLLTFIMIINVNNFLKVSKEVSKIFFFFLILCYRGVEAKWVKMKVAPFCPALCDLMGCPWNSPGQNTTQASNPGLSHCKQILYRLSHKGNLRTLAWVAYPFSKGSSRPRNRTGVSRIAGRFL